MTTGLPQELKKKKLSQLALFFDAHQKKNLTNRIITISIKKKEKKSVKSLILMSVSVTLLPTCGFPPLRRYSTQSAVT